MKKKKNEQTLIGKTYAFDKSHLDCLLGLSSLGQYLQHLTVAYIIIFLCVATLPWPERVAKSIEKFEQEREETRREQQVIGRSKFL